MGHDNHRKRAVVPRAGVVGRNDELDRRVCAPRRSTDGCTAPMRWRSARTLIQPLTMSSRDPTAEVAEAIAQIAEMVVDLRRQRAMSVYPPERQRIETLLSSLMGLQLSHLPRALSTWRADPSDDAEVWSCLADWHAVQRIMSPSPRPARRRSR